jgi:hypothetical protein
MTRIIDSDHPMSIEEFLNQLNVLYIYICLYL